MSVSCALTARCGLKHPPSRGDRPEAKEPDLAWRAAGAVALIAGIEVDGRRPRPDASVPGQQLGPVPRGRTPELDRAFGVRQQVGTPGRVLWAPIVGPDRDKPVGVVDQGQRM